MCSKTMTTGPPISGCTVGAAKPVPVPSVMQPEVVTTVEVRPKRLVQTKTELKGTSATFEADHEAGTLLVRGDTFELLMTRVDVEQFIWELVEAYESIPKDSRT